MLDKTNVQWQDIDTDPIEPNPTNRNQSIENNQMSHGRTTEGQDGEDSDELGTHGISRRRRDLVPNECRMDAMGDCGENDWVIENIEESERNDLIAQISVHGSCAIDLLQYCEAAESYYAQRII